MSRSALSSVLQRYWDLGFTSFGGPGVHVVILRERFVDKYKWLDSRTFLDLFALGNALPGPGSTQLAFSIAVVKHGLVAGLFAFALWSLPGALGMAGLAVGISHIPDRLPSLVMALLTGLNAAAVGLIALAAVQLAKNAVSDNTSLLLLWLSASFGICYHAPWMYPTLIAAGGVSTLVWDFRRHWTRWLGTRRRTTAPEQVEMSDGAQRTTEGSENRAPNNDPLNVVSPQVAVVLLIGFIMILVVPLATRAGLKNGGKSVPRALDFFSNMLVAGTIIFGGGPVVIPLLRDYAVATGWVSDRDFLLIFAILQAFPGPNFNFAVALGVLALSEARPLGAVLGYIGIFLPGILLKLALLPLYSSWRDKSIARSVIRGLNATASGLVFTAVYQLFLVGYIYQSAEGTQAQSTRSGPLTADPFWAVVASGSFLATRSFRSPPWLSIIGGGLAGLAWYGVRNT